MAEEYRNPGFCDPARGDLSRAGPERAARVRLPP
jgi:hypothetical protein